MTQLLQVHSVQNFFTSPFAVLVRSDFPETFIHKPLEAVPRLHTNLWGMNQKNLSCSLLRGVLCWISPWPWLCWGIPGCCWPMLSQHPTCSGHWNPSARSLLLQPSSTSAALSPSAPSAPNSPIQCLCLSRPGWTWLQALHTGLGPWQFLSPSLSCSHSAE